MKQNQPACPCKRLSCIRHGDCKACRAEHHGGTNRYRLTSCERLKEREKRRLQRKSSAE